ncbi:Probable polyketide synthase 37,Fusaridione A synthetase fsdS,Lovastatin nonaketide synthase mokA,Equisetin synthetase eqxS,Phthiocerol/phenolphthiocerol synthesis polyketide synthase type I PpsA,Highly reducing polyketide synthase calA,Phthiocerol synthesis polyketide synthase type I PpsA,Reducing polyketide synthase swnK,Hybrid PKS-NRPS synthetase apdA,Probable polyketide synthase 16,Highly reducing polyketide synthase cla2,Fusarielin synthase FSL1,Hybrid PKS-NRPS synthetase lepA,Lovastatin nonaketide sy|uniref:Ketosynthase family 3 (KS3) domain-containing protein n=1 Tax=Mytilus edulis TaxID=6550 RepID=A0A8S3TIQ9_MYTED|nr:Probable polyketide synthase 37,Fusaridione A synthetase fsdS,Lovastatin nonaketide synthase mokA,Equisetin synthetase eqxS,Phthiocerol/phenolphthiocerol synthesis polyketide synthase type I PpsA,Highly reducing polyketide synthase calA,Phthiocerol synthesis polyketide synthase type I PpsA,Reducing polyketide synthase swnK,Hybrid PKS-NRPS synthetase apdA,Probable polyketide synthase 16,Highly reducing polyketide synthase cla2,Fusarielin synthase FSL1,Hybrid PKS-NRPS synthetase lepA,Lovastatin no
MEEIVVVGTGCRFPGSDDLDEFWGVLKNGEDHVLDIPKERWNVDIIDIANLDDEWKPHASKSGLLKDFDKWDNKFFGISDLEAGWMDPQQCLALEVAYSALEDGGFTREMIKGTDTGVYIGCMNKDMSLGLNEAAHEYNNSLVTGMASSIISNRLSYLFDIRGPSLTIDTACSSALVAIHLGCQAIRSVMSGCNQDGKENTPITAPSGNQQKELLKRVYSSHKINPADIQYIESHGNVESRF